MIVGQICTKRGDFGEVVGYFAYGKAEKGEKVWKTEKEKYIPSQKQKNSHYRCLNFQGEHHASPLDKRDYMKMLLGVE